MLSRVSSSVRYTNVFSIRLSRSWIVRLGSFNLTDDKEEWTEKAIKEIKIHPQFEKTSKTAYHDVAVLILESAVIFDDNIRPVCLPDSPSPGVNFINILPADFMHVDPRSAKRY